MLHTLGEFKLAGRPLRRPKPLLLLAYLALEGSTSRRTLAELFFGEAKDPRDSLSSALKHLREHLPNDLTLTSEMVSTSVLCDAKELIRLLDEDRLTEAVALYQGPFVPNLDLPLGEELEAWLASRQDSLAQRLRMALLKQAQRVAEQDKVGAARLAEQAWRLTKDQGIDAETFASLYGLLLMGSSPYALEIRRQAVEYGIPLILPSGMVPSQSDLPSEPQQGPRPFQMFIADLQARLEDLAQGEESLALGVWGAPGIGKTYLLRQALKDLSYQSYSVHASIPLAKLLQRLPKTGLPSWARTILARLSEDKAVPSEDVSDSLGALLAEQAPVALHVEDLHEVDGERLELWTSLATLAKRSPGVALIVTSRQAPPEIFEALQPPPLALEEAAELLAGEAGSALPEAAVVWLHEHAAGNPLFTLEFFRYLRRQGNLWSDGGRWRWRDPETLRIPTSIEVLVSQAIQSAALSDAAARFMNAKALLPVGTSYELMVQVADVEEALPVVRAELEANGILREGVFAHPLYREMLKRELPRGVRAALSRRIITTLAATEPETAAPFLDEAGLDEDGALEILVRAAGVAEHRGHERHAGELLARAAEYAAGERKRELLLDAARFLHAVQPARAQQLLERVLEAEPLHVEGALLLARCLLLQGEGERAERVMHRLPPDVRPVERWLKDLVHLRTERTDYGGALELWHSHPELQGIADVATKRDVAFALLKQGSVAEADALLSETLQDPLLSPEERASLLEVRGSIALYTGRYHDSLALLDEAIELLMHLSGSAIARQLTYALRYRTMVYWGLCRLREAVRDTEEMMRLASELGSGRDYAIAQAYLGVSLTELGDYARAEEELLESREVLERSDAQEHLAACEAMLAGVYIYWQPPNAAAQALRHAHRSLAIAREMNAPVVISQALIYAAGAEAMFGTGERALAAAQECIDIATQLGQQRVFATALWTRGLALEKLGENERALADFEEAERIQGELGLIGWATYAGLDAARLRNDWDKARKHVEVLRELGVVGYTLLARQRFAPLFESGQPLV